MVFQEEVVQAVEKVCSLLPPTLSAQCKDLIETYGQAIIELLIQEVDPKTVCSLLGLCRDASRAFIREFLSKCEKWFPSPMIPAGLSKTLIV